VGQRIYSMGFDTVTIAAVQDALYLKAGAANGIEIHHIQLSAGAVTAAAEIRLRLKRLPATVTAGSGGTAPTISTIDSGDTKSGYGYSQSERYDPSHDERHGGDYLAVAVERAWHVRVSSCPGGSRGLSGSRGFCFGYCGNTCINGCFRLD
jgi:hypothetical protein